MTTRIWHVEYESRDPSDGTWAGNAAQRTVVARTASEALRKAKKLGRYDQRPSAVGLQAEA